MTTHTSATAREPHVNQTTRTNTIVNALKRRAQAVLNDKSIDAPSRAIIRYALEINDPWLAELVRRADGGEPISEACIAQVYCDSEDSTLLLSLLVFGSSSTRSDTISLIETLS